jgi:hypothetical protein
MTGADHRQALADSVSRDGVLKAEPDGTPEIQSTASHGEGLPYPY